MAVDRNVERLELSVKGLFELLGKDRERFWEILKGITTPVEDRLARTALAAAERDIATAAASLKTLEAVARQVGQKGR